MEERGESIATLTILQAPDDRRMISLVGKVRELIREHGAADFRVAHARVQLESLGTLGDKTMLERDLNISLGDDTHDMVSQYFELLRRSNSLMGYESVTMEIGSNLNGSKYKAVIATLKHFNELRLKNDGSRKWKKIVLSYPSESCICLLNEEWISLFDTVVIDSTKWVSDIPDALMVRLQSLCQKGLIPKLEFCGCALSPFHSLVLKTLLDSNRLQSLKLKNIIFQTPSISLEYLREAFQGPSAILPRKDGHGNSRGDKSTVVLESLTLQMPFEQPQTKWSASEHCGLISSLRGLACLKSLDLTETSKSENIFRQLGGVISSPDCQIQTLRLFLSDFSESAGGVLISTMEPFLSSFSRNNSIQSFEFDVEPPGDNGDASDDTTAIPDSLVKRFILLAMSPHPKLQKIDMQGMFEISELSKILEEDLVEVAGPQPKEGLGCAEVFYHHSCKIRAFNFGIFYGLHVPTISFEDLQSILWLVSYRLPYLYNISMDIEATRRKFISTQEVAALKRTEEAELFDELTIRLEQNQVGRALLHSSISVPLGLWAEVLAKASSRWSVHESNVFCGRDRDLSHKPWDGIFYMVKELVVSGKLRMRENAKQRSRSTNHRRNEESDDTGAAIVTRKHKYRRLS
jgi:hypothetical protein